MIDEKRFDRVEAKVDKLNDDVVEVKTGVNYINSRLDEHLEAVQSHISSDARIIKQIAPLLDQLPTMAEIIEEYRFEKKKKEHLHTKIKLVSLVSAIVVSLIAILNSIFK
jgi:uncharacterized coiled-coil DUF342 family protein